MDMDFATLLKTYRKGMGWTQEEIAQKWSYSFETISAWERKKRSPGLQEIPRLAKLLEIAPQQLATSILADKQTAKEALGLAVEKSENSSKLEIEIEHPEQRKTVSLPAINGSFEEILSQCATGITICHTLSDHGEHDEIVLATHILETYMPILQAILNTSSSYRLQSAALISKIFQVKHGTAYHLEGTKQSLAYAKEAVHYARTSENVTELVTALHELASIHEWPLPSLSVYKSRKKALTLIEEATYLQEQQDRIVPSQIQSWISIGRAKLQALNGLKQEAYTSIGAAQIAFAKNANDLPGLYFNQVNLIRQESITYSYLNEQEKAIETFLKLIDENDAQFAPRFPMHARTHLSLLSEVVISSLKRPTAKKDKDLTVRLWKAELQKAQRLQSVTYVQEAQTAYQIMECVWPDDPEIKDLYDLLY
jgi:transcriptional regulator with XRE-family HTH domain